MSRGRIDKGTRARVYREYPHNCHYCGIALAHPAWDGTVDWKWVDVGNPRIEPFWTWTVADGHREAHIDHVQPRSKGGSNRYENLVLSCDECNMRKGAKWPYQP